jgi:hypothetical protein
MGKPPTFREPFRSPALDHEHEGEKHAAPGWATKLAYVTAIILIVLLFLLVGIGLHMPRGG